MCTEETNKVAKIKKTIYYALLLLYCPNLVRMQKVHKGKGDWFPLINSTYIPTNHRLNIYGLDYQNLIGLHAHSCTQPMRAHTPPAFCLFLSHSHLSLIYEGAIGQPKKTTSPCDPPRETLPQTYVNKLSLNS
jgi:hypothetical protein